MALGISRWWWSAALAVSVVMTALAATPSPARAAAITEFSSGISAGNTPGGIVAGPDGDVWFTELHAIARITPSGQITEFSSGLQSRQHAVRRHRGGL